MRDRGGWGLKVNEAYLGENAYLSAVWAETPATRPPLPVHLPVNDNSSARRSPATSISAVTIFGRTLPSHSQRSDISKAHSFRRDMSEARCALVPVRLLLSCAIAQSWLAIDRCARRVALGASEARKALVFWIPHSVCSQQPRRRVPPPPSP